MRENFIALVVLVLLFVGTDTVQAQGSTSIAPGERVRVSAPDIQAKRFVGTLVTLGADSLILQSEDSVVTTAVALAGVEMLEVTRGKKRNVLNGLLVGGAVGVGLGVLAGSGEDDSWDMFIANETVLYGGVLGIAGGLLGGAVGFIVKSDRWEEIPPEKIQAEISPMGNDGFVVSLTFTF